LNNLVWVLTVIVVMTAFLCYFLFYTYKSMVSINLKSYSIILLLFAMMASMLNGITYYLDMPVNFVNTVIAFNLSMVEMTLFVVYLLWIASTRRRIDDRNKMSLGVAGLVIWNEISMGLTLISLAYPASIKDFSGSPMAFSVYFYSLGTNTFLFIIPMAAEMALILFLFHRNDTLVYPLSSIILMALLSPTFLGNKMFVVPGVVLSAVVMTLFALVYILLISRNTYGDKTRDFRRLVALVFYIYIMIAVVEAIGLIMEFVFRISYPYAWAAYSVVMVVTMFLFFDIGFSGRVPRFFGSRSVN